MRRLLLLFIVLTSMSANAQTYLNTPYSHENLLAIQHQLETATGSIYSATEINFAADRPQAHIYFNKADANKMTVTINKRLVNDSPVIDQYAIAAPFKVVLNLYKTLFNLTANDEDIKSKGHAEPVVKEVNGKRISIAFYVDSTNPSCWDIRVKNI